jgi:hypothetical protein
MPEKSEPIRSTGCKKWSPTEKLADECCKGRHSKSSKIMQNKPMQRKFTRQQDDGTWSVGMKKESIHVWPFNDQHRTNFKV